MRRRLLWTTGILLLLIAAGIIVMARKPTAPFSFLGQHDAIINLGPTVDPDVKRIAFEYQGDWDRHIKQATQELLGWGYRRMRSSTDKQLSFVFDDPTIDHFSIVVITKDERVSSPDFLLGRGHPGWITVDILGTPPPTLLDRIRTWLGL